MLGKIPADFLDAAAPGGVAAQAPDPILSTQRLRIREDRILSTQRLPMRAEWVVSIERALSKIWPRSALTCGL